MRMSHSPEFPDIRVIKDGIPRYLSDTECTKPIRNNPNRVRPL